MENKNKKKNDIIIINKFKEHEIVDLRKILENTFKIYYNLKVKKCY